MWIAQEQKHQTPRRATNSQTDNRPPLGHGWSRSATGVEQRIYRGAIRAIRGGQLEARRWIRQNLCLRVRRLMRISTNLGNQARNYRQGLRIQLMCCCQKKRIRAAHIPKIHRVCLNRSQRLRAKTSKARRTWTQRIKVHSPQGDQ